MTQDRLNLESTAGARWIHHVRLPEVLVVVTLIVAVLGWFTLVSQALPLDLDEAYYVIAGTRVTSGELPYRDFFFPQTPLSPYLFGTWSSAFGVGFVTTRYLGAILASAIGIVIAFVVRRRVGVWHAVLALAYYCSSIQVILWMPRLKTYGISSLLTVLALVCVTRSRIHWHSAVIAGILAGLSASTRLLFVPIPVLIVIAIIWRDDLVWSERRKYGTWALFGAVIGIAPILACAFAAPDAFLFDNVTYHALRDGNESLIGNFGQKLRALHGQIRLRGDTSHESLQFLVLIPAGIAMLVRRFDGPRYLKVFPLAALVLLVVSYLPTPVYRQYLVTVVPTAILALCLLGLLHSPKRLWLATLLLLPYMYASYHAIALELGRATRLRPAAADQVGHTVQTLTKPGDVVAGLRAHLLFAAERPIEPCSYNSFARRDWGSLGLTEEQIRRYHLCSNEDIVQAIGSGVVKAFVARPNEDLGLAEALDGKGWMRVEQPVATIWIAP